MGKIYTRESLGLPPAPEVQVPSEDEATQSIPDVPPSPKIYTRESLGVPPKGYKPPGVMEDAPPSAISGGGRGAMNLYGLPGSAAYYAREGVGLLSDVLTGSEQRKLDVQRAEEENLTREQRQAIAEGKAVPFGAGVMLPTMLGAESVGRENLPYFDYKPSTKTGEVIQSGAQMGTESLIGGPRGILRRFATGFGAGAGSDIAGDVGSALGGPSGKLIGDIGGAVAADLISHKILDIGANLGFTSKKAYEELTDAISADMAANPDLRAKLRQSIENGEPIYVADLLTGNAANALLRAGYTQKQINALNNINTKLSERRDRVQDAVDEKFSDLFQRDLRDDTYKAAVEAANKLERNKLYTDLKALPQAQSVMSPNLVQLYKDNGYISDAMDAVTQKFMGKYLPPDVIPPVGGMSPNLQYWNFVKFELDDIIKRSKTATDKKGEADLIGATKAKQLLVDELDFIVPEYKTVRNEAADMFEAENSLEAGYKLAQKSAYGSPFDVGDFMVKFDKLKPEQKEAFAEGAARYAMQKAKGNMSGLISYMENPNVNRALREVMGPDRFDALYAKAVSENLAASAEGFKLTEGGNIKKIATLVGEMGGGALGLGGFGALATLNPVGLATVGSAAVGALAGIALNASERKVANRVIELAFSTKREDAQKFAKLLADNYDAVSVVRKMGDYMQSATQKGILAYLQSQREALPAPTSSTPGLSIMAPMNTGGRIGRKSGGRIKSNPISAEVRRVRALLSEKTASMLSVPDDAIATALHIAKGK